MATGDTALRLTRANTEYLKLRADLIDYTADYTKAVWIYMSSDPSASQHVMTTVKWLSDVDDIYINSSLVPQFYARASGETDLFTAGTTTLSTGTWYHFALVRTGTTLECFLDGVLEITGTLDGSGRVAATTEAIGIGVWSDDATNISNPLDGRVKGYKAWTRALTAAEVTAEMAQNAPVSHEDLWSYSPLDDGNSDDWSGNLRNWTQIATPTIEAGPGIPLGTPSIQVVAPPTPALPEPPPPVYTPADFEGVAGNYLELTGGVIDCNAAYTQMAWVKFDDFDGTTIFSHVGGPGDYETVWLWQTGGRFRMETSHSWTVTEVSPIPNPGPFSLDTWHHVSMVRESDTVLTLWVDGVNWGSITTASVTSRSALSTIKSGESLNGRLGSQKLFNYALTENEILSEMQQLSPVGAAISVCPGWDADITGNNNEWEIVGQLGPLVEQIPGIPLGTPSLQVVSPATAAGPSDTPLSLLISPIKLY